MAAQFSSTAGFVAGRPSGTRAIRVPGWAARLPGMAVRAAATVVLIAGVVAFLFLAVGPRVFGYRTATMLTGSMVPTINPGDVVIVTEEPASELKVGQIVSYRIPVYDHHVESHRVISVERKGDSVVFRTKGDANANPDPWTAELNDPTIWRVRGVVPYLGTAIRDLRQPLVAKALRFGIPVLVVGTLLVGVWSRDEEETEAQTSSAARNR